MEKIVNVGRPTTLMQAHEELVRIRPDRDASLKVWLTYYQRSATLYAQIAATDPDHESEARYWSQREQVRARDIQARINANRSERSLP